MCWRPKDRYYLLKTFKSVYNRCVLFDGKKLPHGMNISNNLYFDESYRFNQVFFFKDTLDK